MGAKNRSYHFVIDWEAHESQAFSTRRPATQFIIEEHVLMRDLRLAHLIARALVSQWVLRQGVNGTAATQPAVLEVLQFPWQHGILPWVA